MTKTIKAFIVVFFIGVFLAPAFAETKSGTVDLKGATYKAPTPEVKLGSKLDATCGFYVTDFGEGRNYLAARVKLHNTASIPMYYSFHIAFFDKDNNLIGCMSQSAEAVRSGLAPDERTELGNCLAPVPTDQIAKIKSYQITYYESDKFGLAK